MSEIRRVSPDHGLQRDEIDGLDSDGNGNISNISTQVNSANALFPSYSFEGQEIIQGEFTYEEPHQFDSERTQTVDAEFMYRTGTDLFILTTQRDNYIADEVVREINSRLSDEYTIRKGLTGSLEDVWGFIKSADHKGSIRIIDESDEIVDIGETDLDEDEITKRMVWDAELFFEGPESRTEIPVIYDGESLTIQVEKLEEAEYVIQLFEEYLLG